MEPGFPPSSRLPDPIRSNSTSAVPSAPNNATTSSQSQLLIDFGPQVTDKANEISDNQAAATSSDLLHGAIDILHNERWYDNNGCCIETIKNGLCTLKTLVKDKGSAHIAAATLLSAFSHHNAIVTPCRQHSPDNTELITTSTIKEVHNCTATELHNNTLHASPSHGGVIVNGKSAARFPHMPRLAHRIRHRRSRYSSLHCHTQNCHRIQPRPFFDSDGPFIDSGARQHGQPRHHQLAV